MKLSVNKNHLSEQMEQIMRKAGYTFINDHHTGLDSFVRRLSGDFYPRFHVYIENNGEKATINIHLDQKKASYPGAHAHNAEYEGENVQNELDRIKAFLRASYVA